MALRVPAYNEVHFDATKIYRRDFGRFRRKDVHRDDRIAGEGDLVTVTSVYGNKSTTHDGGDARPISRLLLLNILEDARRRGRL